MLTIDDDDINDRFKKRDVGYGFVSTAEDNPAEIRPSSWRWVHGWGYESVAEAVTVYILGKCTEDARGVARPSALVAERNRDLPGTGDAQNEIPAIDQGVI